MESRWKPEDHENFRYEFKRYWSSSTLTDDRIDAYGEALCIFEPSTVSKAMQRVFREQERPVIPAIRLIVEFCWEYVKGAGKARGADPDAERVGLLARLERLGRLEATWENDTAVWVIVPEGLRLCVDKIEHNRSDLGNFYPITKVSTPLLRRIVSEARLDAESERILNDDAAWRPLTPEEIGKRIQRLRERMPGLDMAEVSQEGPRPVQGQPGAFSSMRQNEADA
jgi:hypothetical protein